MRYFVIKRNAYIIDFIQFFLFVKFFMSSFCKKTENKIIQLNYVENGA